MYLKRLELQGFKSFANKTVLDFLPPQNGRLSITAVVGPNGSGKSNITDAIRWVMGETSLKNLRGKKSEDVIFGGSESKGQLGAAEVTMVLDNADGKAQIDYPEISITRRVYRNGEGEYFINNNPCRLLDIHLLLAKAQFAEHAYSIVSQGMIDRLLIVGPAERKDFLDEASGIKEFQIKQHQAQLKLTRTRENMEQAERLLAEVEPRLKILARQVKKLEKRQEVELALREAQEKYYNTLYTRLTADIAAVGNRLQTIEGEYRASFAELEKLQSELALLARCESRQEVFSQLQSRHQAAVREKNEWERQLAIIDGRMQTQYQEAGKGNIGWLENKVKELKAKRDEISVALKTAEAEGGRVEAAIAEKKKEVEKLTIEKTEKTVQISRLQSAAMQSQSEQNFFQFSGLATVKAVLEAKNNFGGKVNGLVAELGEVEEAHRSAMDVAAGANLSSIVVEDDEVGKRAIEYLRSHRLGVATFLPLNKIHARTLSPEAQSALTEAGVVGLAIDLIKFNSKYREIFEYIFGDTVVVVDLPAAQRIGIGRCRMVTLDGDLIEKRGVMKGGYRGKDRGLSFSTRLALGSEGRAKEFQAQVTQEQQNLLDLEARLEKAKQSLLKEEVSAESARHKVTLEEEGRASVEKEIAGLERELSMLQISPKEYGVLMVKLAREKEMMTGQLAGAEKTVNTIAGEIEEFNHKEEEKKQRVFTLQTQMQEKQNSVNNILTSRNDLKIEAARLETKKEDLETEAQNEMGVSVSCVAERNTATVSAEELPAVADNIQKLKYQLSLIGGIDEEVAKEYGETKERYDFLSSQTEDLGKATEDLGQMIEELDDLMKKKRDAAFRKIRKEFSRYFKILFDGGSADLTEIYGEPPVEEELAVAAAEGASAGGVIADGVAPDVESESKPKVKGEKFLYGIDIIANPPGKKIKHLNALSGGERTLTSIALICAILNCNPSPFVVLDEVEAALDEANTQRFARIMTELTTQSQFIIITHNRVTMHHADALYGVAMGGDGISRLLSVKLEEAQAIDKNGQL